MRLGIQDIMRASHTMRFTIVNTSRIQSVAEHSFNVCMLARAIAKVLNVPDGRLIKMALEHDLDEVVTGDIPTPTKHKMVAEGIYPDKLRTHRTNNVGETIEYDILKMADHIDTYFFIRDHGIGGHADQVKKSLLSAMKDHLETRFSKEEAAIIDTEVIRRLYQGNYTI